jgi:hypothetical protein
MVTWPFIPVSRPAACLASQAAGETAHLLLRRFSSRVDTPMIIVQATLNSSTGLVSYFNFTNLHLQKGSCKVTVTVICRGNPHELGCCPSSCPVNHFVHTPLSLHFGPWAREQRPTCRPNCVLSKWLPVTATTAMLNNQLQHSNSKSPERFAWACRSLVPEMLLGCMWWLSCSGVII